MSKDFSQSGAVGVGLKLRMSSFVSLECKSGVQGTQRAVTLRSIVLSYGMESMVGLD